MHWSKSPVTFPSVMIILQDSSSCSPAWERQTEEGKPPTRCDEHQNQRAPPGQLCSTAFRCLSVEGQGRPMVKWAGSPILVLPPPALFSTPCHEAPLSLEASRSPPTGIKKKLDTVTLEVLSTLAHFLVLWVPLPLCLLEPGLS